MKRLDDIVVKRAEEGLYVAHCPSLPGIVGRGPTATDAAARAKEVIAAYLDHQRNHAATPMCDMTNCEVDPMYHFTLIERRLVVTEKHLCDPHAEKYFTDFRASQFVGEGSHCAPSGSTCVDLEMIAFKTGQGENAVCLYLHEVGGTRRLCILTDGWAWWGLIGQLKRHPAPRPRTHAAWYATIVELGGELQDVVLDRNDGEDWWTATLRISKDSLLVAVDVRASDACILATTADVPIVVDEGVLERYADQGNGISGR